MSVSPAPLGRNEDAGASTTRIGRSEFGVCVGVVALIIAEHLAFGGGRREVAFAFAAVQALTIAGLVACCAWARDALRPALVALKWPAIAFCLVVAAALWSLLPWVLGGPHPVWSYVEAPAAAALNKSAVLLELIRLAALACMFLVGWILGAQTERARTFLTALVYASGVFAAWAFVAQLADPQTIYGFVGKPYGGDRLTAAFFSANTAGTCFAAILILGVCLLLEKLRSGSRAPMQLVQRAAPSGAIVAISAAALILTASRGAGVAACAALLLLVVWEARARRWRLFGRAGLGVAALLVLLAALFVVGGDLFYRRLSSMAGSVDRLGIYRAHWSAFRASPWLGYGLGGFDRVNALIMTATNYRGLWNIHAAHDVYLQWLEEAGVLGAAPMFACVGLLVLAAARGSSRRRRMTTWLRGLTAVAVVFIVHGATDYALQVPSMASFWACLLGVGAGLAFAGRAPPTEDARQVLPMATVAAGLLFAVLAALASWQLAAPKGASRVSPLPLAQAYEQAAGARLSQNPGQARVLLERQLRLDPANAWAWLHLAEIETATHGRPTPAAVLYVSRSCSVGPLDTPLMLERVAFIYDHYRALGPDERDCAARQIRAAWPQERRIPAAALWLVHDPAGQLALATELFSLRIQDLSAKAGR